MASNPQSRLRHPGTKRALGLALAVTAADALWAWQALAARPQAANSAVAMAGFAVWMVFHLPATAAGGGLLRLLGLFQSDAQGLRPVARAILAGAGLAQTFTLAALLALWRRR